MPASIWCQALPRLACCWRKPLHIDTHARLHAMRSSRMDEVQLAGQYAPQGMRLRLAVPQGDAATLARRVLKSDTATVR